MKVIVLIMITALAVLSPGYTEDRFPEPGKGPAGPSQHKSRDDMKKHVETTLAKIKEDDPERYNKLIELRKTDRRKFMQELRSSMRPDADRTRKAGDKTDGHRHGQGPGNGRRFGERFLDHLKSQDPERFEHIQKLRKDDPEAFRKEMGKIFSSFRNKHFKKDGRIDPLVSAYKNAGTEAEKVAAKEKLSQAVVEGFEKRMALKEKELTHLKNRIAEIEKTLKSYRDSKDAICNKRLQELLEHQPDGGERPRRLQKP